MVVHGTLGKCFAGWATTSSLLLFKICKARDQRNFGTRPCRYRVLKNGFSLTLDQSSTSGFLAEPVKEALANGGKQNIYPRSKKVNDKQNKILQNELPTQLLAVLTIVSADQELRQKALPFVNIERQEVNWTEIFKNDLGSGHRAALVWVEISLPG